MRQYFGKYRGSVENNLDPLQQGRLQVSAPSVLGDSRMSWAMPCVPFAGPGVGLYALPPIGANVWVEFEGGDPDYPIWTGCFWGVGELPAQPALPTMKVFRAEGISLVLNELPGAGGLAIEIGPPIVATPLKVAFSAEGIEIANGAASIKLSPASVNINNGALEVI